MNELSKAMHSAMEKRGWREDMVAKRSGLDLEVVHGLAHGWVGMTRARAKRLAKAFAFTDVHYWSKFMEV